MNRNGYVFDFEGFRVYVAADLIHPKTLIPYHCWEGCADGVESRKCLLSGPNGFKCSGQ